MKWEPRANEPRRDQVRLRQKRYVAVPPREDVRVGPFEFPHRNLEFPGQVVQVPAHDHRREDRVLAAEHQHLALPEAQLLEGPAPVVERVADELLEDDQHPAHDVAVMDHALRAGTMAGTASTLLTLVQIPLSGQWH